MLRSQTVGSKRLGMAIEKHYEAISPVFFTADGQNNGIITVEDTFCFKVKMVIVINADGKDPLRQQIKRVLSNTQMILGEEHKSLHNRSDLSSYLLALNPTVKSPEQPRPNIPPADYERAAYEEEPTLAKRSYEVDKYGNPFTLDNPKPVTEAGFSFEDRVKGALMCAPDLERAMTWAEIDGVRRVVKIVYTADSVDTFFAATIDLTRDFTYQTADPFDLINIKDTLVVV